MATRTSSATWEGNLKEGKGTMKVGRGAYEGPFSFASRFENGAGTNPEELIGAAIFLASHNASSFVTGTDIRVDGGFLSQTI